MQSSPEPVTLSPGCGAATGHSTRQGARCESRLLRSATPGAEAAFSLGRSGADYIRLDPTHARLDTRARAATGRICRRGDAAALGDAARAWCSTAAPPASTGSPGRSDINTAIVVRRVAVAALDALAPVVARWRSQGVRPAGVPRSGPGGARAPALSHGARRHPAPAPSARRQRSVRRPRHRRGGAAPRVRAGGVRQVAPPARLLRRARRRSGGARRA